MVYTVWQQSCLLEKRMNRNLEGVRITEICKQWGILSKECFWGVTKQLNSLTDMQGQKNNTTAYLP